MKLFAVLVFVVTLTLGLAHFALHRTKPATPRVMAQPAPTIEAYKKSSPSQKLPPQEKPPQATEEPDNTELHMKIGVTIVLGAACLYISFAPKSDVAAKHFAYTTMGTIVGFWLGGSK